ncbi:hypothetical protein [Solibacillus sp. NPDC093137]|uniref:hypothetical protein n=1 Tax=Solibacillus sp. NPDC093137 TaxID=3390678 RepID=UPI003D03BB9C
MFQNFFERAFVVTLHLLKWLFIILICCSGIIIGLVLLAILGFDIPDMEPFINIISIPLMLFGNKISLIILNIIIAVVVIVNLFLLRKKLEE